MTERLGWDRGRRRDNGHLGIRLGWDKFKRNPGYVWQGTVSGLRVSTVNGVALIDNAGAVIPTFADGSHSIEIYAAGLMLRGVLSAAGTVETYTDIVVGDDSTFVSDTGWWSKGTNWTIGSGVASHSGAGNENLYKEGLASEVVGGLYYGGLDLTFTGGSYLRMFFAGQSLFGNQTVSATYSGYKTGTGISGLMIPYGVGFVGSIDNVILRRITAPSTAGAVIVSAKGGAVQNWTTNQWVAGSYNLSSYEVKIRAI